MEGEIGVGGGGDGRSEVELLVGLRGVFDSVSVSVSEPASSSHESSGSTAFGFARFESCEISSLPRDVSSVLIEAFAIDMLSDWSPTLVR